MGVGEQYPSKESGAAKGLHPRKARAVVATSLPCRHASWKCHLRGWLGIGKWWAGSPGAETAFAPTHTTPGSLEHYFLWKWDRAYCTSSPDLQNFGKWGGDGPYCITPSSKSAKGQRLAASVSWPNQSWHTGFSLPEKGLQG